MDPPDSVHVGETLLVQVRALNRSGDSIPGAAIVLVSLTPDTLAVPAGQHAVTGVAVGPGRIVAEVGTLQSGDLSILVK